ncbi:MAG TPA: hypothetical protein VGQ00_00800 [Candidatus Norongarragalinales archaeon]|jgi:hypothetical protein|nr:hypothetical protein [Candidatus Norongarragalinales archaeon]
MVLALKKIRDHVDNAKTGLPPHFGQRLQLALNSMERAKNEKEALRARGTLVMEAKRIRDLYTLKRPSWEPKPPAVAQNLDPLIAILEKKAA